MNMASSSLYRYNMLIVGGRFFWIFRSENWNFDALFYEGNDKIIGENVFLLTSLILISNLFFKIDAYYLPILEVKLPISLRR